MNPAFEIVSEFKFEIGSALVGSQQLQNAVQGVSDATDNALFSFQKLGMGIMAQMGLGTGGVLGMLYEAIQASEKFGMTQRKLANIFLSNQDKIAGGPIAFKDAMFASNEIMDEILKKSREFGIGATPLAEMTALLGAPLFAAGAAGKNLSPAIDIARGMLKSAPVLGIDAGQAQQQVVSMILGRGNIQDQFVNRIIQDTDVFRKLLGEKSSKGGHGAGGALGPFNALSIDKRVETLTKALLQFASSTEIVEANAKSLTQQLVVFKDTISGMFSILKPIGETIAQFIAPMLQNVNNMIQTRGAEISRQMAAMMKKIIGDPETFIENILQLRALKQDLLSTASVLSISGIVGAIGQGLKFLGITARFASPWFSALGGSLTLLYDIWDRTPSIMRKVALIGAGVIALGAALVMFPPLAGILAISAGITGLFQLFSRAQAIAKVKDFLQLPRIIEDFTRLSNAFATTFGRMMKPLFDAFDGLAHLLAPMFELATWADWLANALFKVVYSVSFVQAAFLALNEGMKTLVSGLLNNINLFEHKYKVTDAFDTFGESFKQMDFFKDPGQLLDSTSKLFSDVFNQLNITDSFSGVFSRTADSFSKEFDRVMGENLSALTDPDHGAVANMVTNIGKVEIRNDFKEQLEPDRIAFTLVEQLKKVAQNPGQKGKSFAGGLVR